MQVRPAVTSAAHRMKGLDRRLLPTHQCMCCCFGAARSFSPVDDFTSCTVPCLYRASVFIFQYVVREVRRSPLMNGMLVLHDAQGTFALVHAWPYDRYASFDILWFQAMRVCTPRRSALWLSQQPPPSPPRGGGAVRAVDRTAHRVTAHAHRADAGHPASPSATLGVSQPSSRMVT